MTGRFYITTPIYYVNDSPHIGHAYTTLACDVIARFMRLDGRQVYFLTGTDEHGQKVEKAAHNKDMQPQAFTDVVSKRFRKLADAMNFSHDDFIRTTETRHKRSVQDLWRRLIEAGEIYLGSYAGWYATRDEAFYTESEITGGKAPSGAPVEWVEEPSYFFRLSDWQDRLLAFYEAHPEFIAPESRRNEVISFVKGGLHDLSVSRTTFKWGVPVPDDDDHVMYVWLDALTNYMSAVNFPDRDSESFKTFWPADVHVVGKDILRFHAVYWPAFLMAAGLEPPRRVFAHGWWTNEGQKISKSLGNVIDPHQLITRYGLDQTRYFLLREVPFGNDGDFSHTAIVRRMNSDLANDYGNLCQRVLSMVSKNCTCQVPMPGPFTEDDKKLLDNATAALHQAREHISKQACHLALDAIWKVIADANRYVDLTAPWSLRKTDPERMATVLFILAETIRRLTIVIQPFMPDSCGKILDLLAVPADKRSFAEITDQPGLIAGTSLPKPVGVFPRFVEEDAA